MIDFNPTPFIVFSSQQGCVNESFSFVFFEILSLKFSANNYSARRIFNAHKHGEKDFRNDSGSNFKFSVRAHAQLSYTNICTYHMEGITGTLLYIYGNCLILEIDPSG